MFLITGTSLFWLNVLFVDFNQCRFCKNSKHIIRHKTAKVAVLLGVSFMQKNRPTALIQKLFFKCRKDTGSNALPSPKTQEQIGVCLTKINKIGGRA